MRCAIYTRKSSAEGLDGEFTSLENQREYCSAYIASQRGLGWTEKAERYDDGGFSGGTLKRPALTRLLEDIGLGKIDVVVVYKIDRLSRSLRDFSNLVADFETKGATFVSVTQAFNTGTSMGRLTLNVLLSFAQFERELTGERLKDWFAGARAKGMWTNQRPYGYEISDRRHLVVVPHEAEVVRRIFRQYIKLRSCGRVAVSLFEAGIMQKNGRPWTGSMVLHAIKHRVYRGELIHRKKWLPGVHEPIVSRSLWERAQRVYAQQKSLKRKRNDDESFATLRGLLVDRCGIAMHHTSVSAKGRLYRYYIAGGERLRYGAGSDAYMRFRAADLEDAVLQVVLQMTGQSPSRYRPMQERAELLRRHLERAEIDLEEMRVVFRTGAEISAEAKGRLGPRRLHRNDDTERHE